MFRRLLKRFKRIISGVYRWKYYGLKTDSPIDPEQPIVYFNLSENKFERYLYLFIRFFLLEGYAVFIRKNFHFIGDLENYSLWLVKENNVHFCTSKPAGTVLSFEDKVNSEDTFLSLDYFNATQRNLADTFHVPMAMHPYFYRDGYWNDEYPDHKRAKSVFFAGSFKIGAYHKEMFRSKFNILNRIEIYDAILSRPETIIPDTIGELNSKTADGQIMIVDRAKFSIPQNQLREFLSRFDFFLACPGVSMPFAHNIIEAMSCGCIPIIEKGYADLFIPTLIDHENALVFDRGRRPLDVVIEEALQMNWVMLDSMHRKVREYYEANLTPHAVVKKMVVQQPQKIYLNAEAHSVKRFQILNQ